MSILTPELASLFNTGARLVHLVALHADGRPHVTGLSPLVARSRG